MKHSIKSEFIICRIDEASFLHDAELSARGLRKDDSTCVELNIHNTFDTKLEALEFLANNHQKGWTEFVILERLKLVEVKEAK